MNTERILKNILWRPEEAFKLDVLQETLAGAIISFFVLGLISSIFSTPQKIEEIKFISRHPALIQFPHIIPLGIFVFLFVGICVQMCVVQFFIQMKGCDIALKTLISGAVWIYCVTVPLGWISHVFFFGWIILLYRVWLMTICIHCLTGFTKQASFWLYLRAILLLAAAALIIAIVSRGLFFLIRPRYSY